MWKKKEITHRGNRGVLLGRGDDGSISEVGSFHVDIKEINKSGAAYRVA